MVAVIISARGLKFYSANSGFARPNRTNIARLSGRSYFFMRSSTAADMASNPAMSGIVWPTTGSEVANSKIEMSPMVFTMLRL